MSAAAFASCGANGVQLGEDLGLLLAAPVAAPSAPRPRGSSVELLCCQVVCRRPGPPTTMLPSLSSGVARRVLGTTGVERVVFVLGHGLTNAN